MCSQGSTIDVDSSAVYCKTRQSVCWSGSFSISTGMITAHQLYNYITDHAGTYGMKPLRMSKTTVATEAKKGTADLHEYALVAVWNR